MGEITAGEVTKTRRSGGIVGTTGEKGPVGPVGDSPSTIMDKDGITRIEYPVRIDFQKDTNPTVMNMFLSYFNQMLAKPALATADGIKIVTVFNDESKFIDNLPIRCNAPKFMDHLVVFVFDSIMFTINFSKFQDAGDFKYVITISSKEKTTIDGAPFFKKLMFRSIELSNVKGTYLYMPADSLGWTPDAKIEKRTFDDVFLPQDITDDVNLYVQFFSKKGRLMRYLMVGYPGTGKTETTMAIVNDLLSRGVTVIKTVPDRILKDKIELAELLAPAVIILDDIDMYLGSRAKGGITDALGPFLDVLDGTDKIKPNVGIIATTNSVELLDLAAQRPGRFDKILSFDSITKKNIEGIIKKSIRKEFENFAYEAEMLNPQIVSDMYEAGLTGAHIYNMVKMLGLRSQTLEIPLTVKWLTEAIKLELATIKKIRNTNYMKDTLSKTPGSLGFGNNRTTD